MPTAEKMGRTRSFRGLQLDCVLVYGIQLLPMDALVPRELVGTCECFPAVGFWAHIGPSTSVRSQLR